jgi:hypothetical protein
VKIVSEKILKRVSGIRPKRVKLPKSHRVSEENPGVESAQKNMSYGAKLESCLPQPKRHFD